MNFHLFGRAIHPELVAACGTRTIERANYRVDLNILPDGHVIIFQMANKLVTEVVAAGNHLLPSQGRLISCSIDRDRVNEPIVVDDQIGYESNVVLESVDANMFVAIQQHLGKSDETHGLLHQFHPNGRIAFGAVSYINVQSFINHVKIRSFHTFPDTRGVLKSESVFSVHQ